MTASERRVMLVPHQNPQVSSDILIFFLTSEIPKSNFDLMCPEKKT
jgi:hypothetical protein